jgi:hypothetical protein
MNENGMLDDEIEKRYLLLVQRSIIPQLQKQDEIEALKALSQQYVINKNNILGFLDEIRDLMEENERIFLDNEKLKAEND